MYVGKWTQPCMQGWCLSSVANIVFNMNTLIVIIVMISLLVGNLGYAVLYFYKPTLGLLIPMGFHDLDIIVGS